MVAIGGSNVQRGSASRVFVLQQLGGPVFDEISAKALMGNMGSAILKKVKVIMVFLTKVL